MHQKYTRMQKCYIQSKIKTILISLFLITGNMCTYAQFYSLEGAAQPGTKYGNVKDSEQKSPADQGAARRSAAEEMTVLDSLVWEYMRYSLPLDDIHVTSAFGTRRDPFTGERSEHSGMDLRARNSRVYAMMDGTVIRTGQDRKSGIYVTIRHDSCSVSYCHLSKVLAKKGKEVKAGEAVAISGNSGKSTGPHLHITYRVNGKTENPAYLIDGIISKKKKLLEEISTVGK